MLMLFKKINAMVRLPYDGTEFLDIVLEVLQGDISVPYMFIICREYILLTPIDLIKENCFTLKSQAGKESSRQSSKFRPIDKV